MDFFRSLGGPDTLGLYREKKLNGFSIALSLLNVLIIPGVVYIVKLEKRLCRIENVLKDLCKKNKMEF